MNLHISRCLWSAPLLAAGMLSPASAYAGAVTAHAASGASPSKLDYLVLSSLADSPGIWAMSSYSPSAPQASLP